MDTSDLREAAKMLCDEIEARQRAVEEGLRNLNEQAEGLSKRGADLGAREHTLAKREASVEQATGDLRKVAAERLTKIKTLEQAVDESNAARLKAEAEKREAVASKTTLEKALATAMQEKAALEEKLAATNITTLEKGAADATARAEKAEKALGEAKTDLETAQGVNQRLEGELTDVKAALAAARLEASKPKGWFKRG